MENKNVLAIFGGSFNPPLNSHFSLAEQIINEYKTKLKVNSLSFLVYKKMLIFQAFFLNPLIFYT